MYRSGSAEEFSEKTLLLSELSDLLAEKDSMAHKQKVDAEKELAVAAKLRKDACQTLSKKKSHSDVEEDDQCEENEGMNAMGDLITSPVSDVAGPSHSRPKKRRSYSSGGHMLQQSTDSIVSYLRQKSDAGQHLERERLELEKKKLEFEEKEKERRAEMDKKELEAREKKAEDDRRERLAVMAILECVADKLK